jgi:hypothetical protein
MKYILFPILVVLYSCCLDDCIGNRLYGEFRIIRKIDEKDLVFGPTSLYDRKKIKFFSLNGIDTIDFEFTVIKDFGYDSILHVDFNSKPARVYLRLNTLDVDTIDMTYHTEHSSCCGTTEEITHTTLNASVDLGGSGRTHVIKK